MKYTPFIPKSSISADLKINYTSTEAERISLFIGELFTSMSKRSRDNTGKGALLMVRGQAPEPIRGDYVYERLLRPDSIHELRECARNRVDFETFRTTIESLLAGLNEEIDLRESA